MGLRRINGSERAKGRSYLRNTRGALPALPLRLIGEEMCVKMMQRKKRARAMLQWAAHGHG
jgi:hypothetical protein